MDGLGVEVGGRIDSGLAFVVVSELGTMLIVTDDGSSACD